MESLPAISVIVTCYNQAYHLKRVLQAYERQTVAEPFELIAVDDASPDETFAVLSAYAPQRYTLRVLRQEKNQGPAAARNRGIEAAQAPLVVFAQDDILPETSFIAEHLAAHRRNPAVETAILGRVAWPSDMPVNSLMKHIDGMGAEQFSYFYLKDGQEYDFRHFYTANISVKRAMLGRVDHWFDTDFPFAAYEDVELSYRLSKKGMKILYDARPLAYHYHYHQIWSFAERQYRAGQMAVVISAKHRGLSAQVLGKGWLKRMAGLWLKSVARPADSEKAAALERKALLLASAYEWSPDATTDWLYLHLLHYFYDKGIIEGSFTQMGSKERVLSYFTFSSLTRLLAQFRAEAFNAGAAFPPGFEALRTGML